MGLKKTIQISDQAVAWVLSRADLDAQEQGSAGYSWAAGLNGAVSDLSWLLGRLVPDLPVTTWQVLLDAYAGHYWDGMRVAPYRLASDVMDHYGALSLEELEPEIAEAVRQLHGLSQPQQHAASELARLFWIHQGRLEGSLGEMIEQCKKML